MKLRSVLQTMAITLATSIALIGSAYANPIDGKTPATLPAVTTDQQIAQKMASAILRNPYYSLFDWVTGSVKGGVVTLEGAIQSIERKEDYSKLAQKIPGVEKVVNNLTVLPNSPFDDQIRLAAARAIYRDSSLLDLQIQPNAPVHIIVDHGNIVLEGVVANTMERQLAEMDARSHTMAFDVVNHLTTTDTSVGFERLNK